MSYRSLYIFLLLLSSCYQSVSHESTGDPSSIEYYLKSDHIKLNIQLVDCGVNYDQMEVSDLILIGKPNEANVSVEYSSNKFYFQLDDMLTDDIGVLKRWSECYDCLERRAIAILADKQTPIDLIKEVVILFKNDGDVTIVSGCLNNKTNKLEYKQVR